MYEDSKFSSIFEYIKLQNIDGGLFKFPKGRILIKSRCSRCPARVS